MVQQQSEAIYQCNLQTLQNFFSIKLMPELTTSGSFRMITTNNLDFSSDVIVYLGCIFYSYKTYTCHAFSPANTYHKKTQSLLSD